MQFTLVDSGAVHSSWLIAKNSDKKVMNSRISTHFYIFLLNPDYVAARSATLARRQQKNAHSTVQLEILN